MDDFPSLNERPERPYGWIQWKGTDVCVDLHCKCGAHLHFDGEFMYFIKCMECGQVYECGGYIKLYPINHDPGNVIELRDEHNLDPQRDEP